MSDEKDVASTWLTVSQAAAARGISERTLRKRIKAGEIDAEKRAQAGGGLAWCVAPMGTEPETERKRDGSGTENRTGSEPEAERKPIKHETPPERKRTGSEMESGPEVSDPRTGSGTESKRIAEMRGEIQFLRGVVEAQNRDAAEMRATMRALVAAQTLALTSGTPQVLAPDETARETMPQVLAETAQRGEMQREFEAQNSATGKQTAAKQDGPQNVTTARDGRGLRGWLLKVLRG